MRLRTVLVDDEELARERLKLMLKTDSDIEIIGECRDGDEALVLLQTTRPDLLFLDIQMPGLTGLEVARQLGIERLPPTVFLTAFREYAVDAFEVAAIDYLTKPVVAAGLQQALTKVRHSIATGDIFAGHKNLVSLLARMERHTTESRAFITRLMVSDGPKDVLIPVREIEWIEASNYYNSLHVKQRTYLLRESLSDLEQRLNPDQFVRVHRSALVNLDYLNDVHREGLREGTLTLKNGSSIRMSKTGRQRLRTLLGPTP